MANKIDLALQISSHDAVEQKGEERPKVLEWGRQSADGTWIGHGTVTGSVPSRCAGQQPF